MSGNPASATREHGTRACYVAGCRRDECRKAHYAYTSHRSRQVAYGRWEPLTDATPVRDHLARLRAAGWAWQDIGDAAGAPPTTVRHLACGWPPDGPPPKRTRKATAAAILAIQPGGCPGSRVRIDATGTRRRLQALIACGWSLAELARRTGLTAGGLKGLLSRPRVSAATAVRVRVLYSQLWNVAPPSGTRYERGASSRAVALARRNDWPVPAAWDDDAIDDPDAPVPSGWQRDSRDRVTAGQVTEDARDLIAKGTHPDLAAQILGMKPKTLERAMYRHPEAGAA